MFRMLITIGAMTAVVFSAVACRRNSSSTGDIAADLAANVIDIGVEALARDDGGPKWQELDKRLDTLFGNNTKEGDEAIVILMSFYLGEHNGEELQENLLGRGPRMIPLIDRYLREEPSSLLNRYPERVRLERTTTVMFLKENLEILRVQSGSRRVASTSVETAPLRNQAGECTVKLVQQPKFNFEDNLVQPGESYRGTPVLRADIEENGDVRNVELLSASGIRRLDTLLLTDLGDWKYAPRPHCGVVKTNIAVTVHWMPQD